MVPHLKYHTAFRLEDGTKPDLTVGKKYELNCVFKDKHTYVYQILDDTGLVHTFHDDEDWFSKHFEVAGNVASILEFI